MGRDRSTIYRELDRNTGGRGYRPKRARRLAHQRRAPCRRPARLDDPAIRQYVRDRLQRRWSPGQIAGRMRRDFPRQPYRRVSRQAIYSRINTRAVEWKPSPRRGGRPPEKRGKSAGCARIDGRPDVINRRRRSGDWEGDTIIGKGRRDAVVTLVERKSGYLRAGRVDDLRAAATTNVTRRRMKGLPAPLRRSVTFDNGKEFADHARTCRHRCGAA
jgi:transposase, IS30 family